MALARLGEAYDALHLVVARDAVGDALEGLEVGGGEKIFRRHRDGDHLVAAVLRAVLLVVLVFGGFLDEKRFHGRVDRELRDRDPEEEDTDHHGQKDGPAEMMDELCELAEHGSYSNIMKLFCPTRFL